LVELAGHLHLAVLALAGFLVRAEPVRPIVVLAVAVLKATQTIL
jgi:hypothetical protein